MKLGYLDCASGISGDMMLGALVDAGAGLDSLNAAIDSLGLPDCRLAAEEVRRAGFRATRVTVHYRAEHVHRHLVDILRMIEGSRLAERPRQRAAEIFRRLAEAEARAHGIPIETVHFHEVGAADSIADIVGAVAGLELLGIERIEASPVPTGTGRIRIAHGLSSVPAPATAELLRGIPLAASSVEAELTTPTGAAILATLVERFGPVPAMTLAQVGCGAGGRNLQEQPNLLRLLIGETPVEGHTPMEGHAPSWPDQTHPPEQIWIVETNLDDASGEMIGYCITRLWEAGALDVFTTGIQMKKNRPGVKLTVLCGPEQRESIEAILLTETTTLGLRRWPAGRRVLPRRAHRVETLLGSVEGQVARLDDGALRFSPEYESCRRIAAERAVALRTVYEAAQRAFDPAAVEARPSEQGGVGGQSE